MFKMWQKYETDVPLKDFYGDIVGVVGRASGTGAISGGDVSETSVAGKTATGVKDYWINNKDYKFKKCG